MLVKKQGILREIRADALYAYKAKGYAEVVQPRAKKETKQKTTAPNPKTKA